MRLFRIVASLVMTAVLASGCATSGVTEISRDRAVDIARSQVTFVPSSVEAVKASASGHRVWRVTIRGHLPGQPPELFETRVFEIDRVTGAIVSVARS
jgi:hypothetical protein